MENIDNLDVKNGWFVICSHDLYSYNNELGPFENEENAIEIAKESKYIDDEEKRHWDRVEVQKSYYVEFRGNLIIIGEF